MYPNLEAELSRRGIKKKMLATIIETTQQTIYRKLSGEFPFTLKEALKIKDELFPLLSIEYLFEEGALNESNAKCSC